MAKRSAVRQGVVDEEPRGIYAPPEVDECEPVPQRRQRKAGRGALRAVQGPDPELAGLSPVERHNRRRRQQLAAGKRRKRGSEESIPGGTFLLTGTAYIDRVGGDKEYSIGDVVELSSSQASKIAKYIERVELDEDGEIVEVAKPQGRQARAARR